MLRFAGTTGLIARDPQSTQNTMDVLRPALCLGLALGMGLAVWTQLVSDPGAASSAGSSEDQRLHALGPELLWCPGRRALPTY